LVGSGGSNEIKEKENKVRGGERRKKGRGVREKKEEGGNTRGVQTDGNEARKRERRGRRRTDRHLHYPSLFLFEGCTNNNHEENENKRKRQGKGKRERERERGDTEGGRGVSMGGVEATGKETKSTREKRDEKNRVEVGEYRKMVWWCTHNTHAFCFITSERRRSKRIGCVNWSKKERRE
jgi:hypothetical protein